MDFGIQNSSKPMNPFSNENSYRDSSMFIGDVVEHTTSWLTINPYKGCSLQCAYCFRFKWGSDSAKPILETEVEVAVENLLAHKDFVPNITAISINVSSTDALLPNVKKSTFKAIELLEAKKLTNPFGITTKLGFLKSDIEFLENLQFIKPIVFVSLAFIPKHIEPTPIEPRLKNLALFAQSKVPCVLYFRPIVSGWNDSDETIEKALILGNKYCNAICIGSLRLSPEIRNELEIVGESMSNYEDDFHLKKFHDNTENRILFIYKKLNLQVPLFKHTSCAVSHLNNLPNYNLLFKNPKNNCLETCPIQQQILCNTSI